MAGQHGTNTFNVVSSCKTVHFLVLCIFLFFMVFCHFFVRRCTFSKLFDWKTTIKLLFLSCWALTFPHPHTDCSPSLYFHTNVQQLWLGVHRLDEKLTWLFYARRARCFRISNAYTFLKRWNMLSLRQMHK